MAVTLDAAGLAAAIGADEIVAARLLQVATSVISRYAPEAPDAIQDEAAIRFAGYLAQSARSSGFGAVRKVGIGRLDVEAVSSHAAAFRNCGAAALLSDWRVRRAGVIG